jgi:hypothetical protein
MLEQLLQFVAAGGVQSYEDLTDHLGISQPLLEAMLEDLARLGYLRALDDRCEGHCAGCSMGSCSVTGPGRLWTLTERGAMAADRLAV